MEAGAAIGGVVDGHGAALGVGGGDGDGEAEPGAPGVARPPLVEPGEPKGGTDHASFLCYGAPAFEMSSVGWDYTNYTWHTNRDTFDKLVFDDLKNNAVLFAMLAYSASEDSQRFPRLKSTKDMPLPKCSQPARNWSQRRN